MRRPQATQTLSEEYRLLQILNLIQDRKVLLYLSLASLVVFVVAWVGLVWLLQRLRPDFAARGAAFSFTATGIVGIILPLIVFLGVMFVMLITHEGIHGLFFWLFTGGSVKFAFKGAYAYAAAPDWYLPKIPYMVVSLAPLVLMTVAGIMALLWVPLIWITPIQLLIAMNASGAVGDMYVFLLLTRVGDEVLIQDFGEQMAIYIPKSDGDVD